MFDYGIGYKKWSTKLEKDMMSKNSVSETVYHISNLLDLQELRECQNKDNVIGGKSKIIIHVVNFK